MILAYLRFLWYIMMHKWYVLRACLSLKVPIQQALLHDWTKFLPPEHMPYVEFFYVYGYPKGQERIPIRDVPGFEERLEKARLRHQTHNPHHWQYWLQFQDCDDPSRCAHPMPERFVREMIADWVGAGKAQGTPDTFGWYQSHKEQIVIHPQTRMLVEHLLSEAQTKEIIP